jgi:hypothetical protein
MSDDHHTRSTLDHVLREARSEERPEIDWKRVDVRLFERVMQDDAQARALAEHRGKLGAWMGLAGLAAVCVTAIAIGSAPAAHVPTSANASWNGPWNESARAAGERSPGDLVLQQGSGEVRIDGANARMGVRPEAGETIDTHGARALFESEGHVSWLLESDSRIRIERTMGAGSALVLALARGAVEAQVTPVTSGEAFAIDVEGIRVAAHGTHLRVARDGDHVVVDLSEGTVSIGAPPKVGSTYGTLVTAPAHVEFRTSALASTLSIDHDAASVRRVAELNSVSDEGASTNALRHSSSSGGPAREETPASPQGWMSKPIPRSSTATPVPNPQADALVANAIRACVTGRPHSTEVTVTVSSTLTIDVQDDGFAHLANFDPPLAPDIQACASRAIYGVRFVSAGPHKIPLELER